MTYTVHMTAAAQADLESIFDDLSVYSASAAENRYELIKNAICGLSEFPRRFPSQGNQSRRRLKSGS